MVTVTFKLDQPLLEPGTDEVVRAIINEAFGRYRTYNPETLTITEEPDDKQSEG